MNGEVSTTIIILPSKRALTTISGLSVCLIVGYDEIV